MIAGILPIVLLLAVAFWGVYESGRKFRNEFRRRGRAWSEVCAALERGEGTLLVDHAEGPSRGLGRPTVWWTPRALGAEDDATEEIADGGRGRLTDCPRKLRDEGRLKARFMGGRVVVNMVTVERGRAGDIAEESRV